MPERDDLIITSLQILPDERGLLAPDPENEMF
jgi:hypothetical protein